MATIHIETTAHVCELREALRTSRDDAQKTRIRAIIKLTEGGTKTAVAHDLTIGRTALIEWVKHYNKGGVDALIFSKGGRPEGNPKWDKEPFAALAKEIDKGGYWSIPRMQKWLKEHHHKDIPEQTVWYRMDQLKYSYKSSRPSPIGGDEEKRTAFKKGASRHSWSR